MTRSLFLLALLAVPLACDKDDDDDDNDSNSGDTQTSQSTTESQTNTTSTEETCVSDHGCIGDVCTCSTPGLENMMCTDDTACEEECEICM